MEIVINQQPQTVPDSCQVRQILQTVWSQQPTGIAIAINNTIIPKTSWDTYQLQPNDHITIIKATQGG
jgi:sulfur carrier protein